MQNFSEEYAFRERDAWAEIEGLKQQIQDLKVETQQAISVVTPAIINFCVNGDALFSQGGLAGATYANKDLSAGYWYTLQSDTSTYLTEHTTVAESGASLQDAAAAGYANPGCDWDLSAGVFRLGGGYSLIHALRQNVILPGSKIFVQLLAKLDAGVSITSDDKLKIAFVDNLAGGGGSRAIITSTPFTPTLAAVGGTGATSRKYVVEIVTQDGTARSSIATIANSVTTLSATQYVSISWASHYGVIQINIYRSEDAGVTYKKITGTGLTGGTSFYDTGIVGTTIALPGSSDIDAATYVSDFGSLLTTEWQRFLVQINVPAYYTMIGSGDKQLLELSITDSAGASVSTTNRGVLVDKVGVSYNNGIWTPAPEDLTTTGVVLASAPDPGSGGAGGTGGGDDGGFLCFVKDTPITLPDGSTKPNQLIETGQLVQSYNPDTLEYVPGIVGRKCSRWVDEYLLISFSDGSYVRVTDEHPFRALFSIAPRLHTHFVRAANLSRGDMVATESGSGIVASITRKIERVQVYNFSITPNPTYIAGHKLVHNVKPLE